jgi:hypothetical protein
MGFRSKLWPSLVVLAGSSLLLSACAQTRLRIEDDFGRAVNQDLAAQIADPDAARNEGAPPPSSGARAGLALTRYRQDAVTPPSTVGASGSNSGYSDANANNAAAPTAAPTAATTAGP